jgi:catechol 2,3-dioxygenase-like lactoylglutathione lyase family enzyme
MKAILLLLPIALLVSASATWAQLAAPNDEGVAMGHLHLNVKDVDANKKFFVSLGGVSVDVPGAPFQVVKFPGALILLNHTDPTGGSVGTVVNHVGFLVQNVQDSTAKWKAAGLTVEAGTIPNQAFVTTPDQLRIEILQDASMTMPIRFHHIHFFVAESSVPEIKAWYATMFGAKPGKRGNFEADDLPGVNLTFSPSPTATVPTKGHVLDHIGFEVANLEDFSKQLQAKGAKLDRPFTKAPSGTYTVFLTDPWGTQIELTQGQRRY